MVLHVTDYILTYIMTLHCYEIIYIFVFVFGVLNLSYLILFHRGFLQTVLSSFSLTKRKLFSLIL